MTIELAAVELLKLCQGKDAEEIKNIQKQYKDCFHFLAHTSLDFEEFLDQADSSAPAEIEELTV